MRQASQQRAPFLMPARRHLLPFVEGVLFAINPDNVDPKAFNTRWGLLSEAEEKTEKGSAPHFIKIAATKQEAGSCRKA
jgi:hypothetical protein